jgi:long-chain acyl-CoA synthetase
MNIVERIFATADRAAIAVICGDQRISYGRLIEMVETASQPIEAVPAARVGLRCPNGVEHIVLALAIVRAGKCLVPIADELCPREQEEVIRRTATGAIVEADGSVHEVESPAAPSFDETALAALNPAFIRFSSGTTARSKGIVISHETLLARVTAANRGLRIGPADRVVWILPMAHHFAVSIMLYLLHGATTIVVTSHLAEDILASAREHGGTVLYGAPFHHGLLGAEASGLPWPTLRLAVSTAAALPVATAQAFEARYGVPLSQGLGIIEVGLPILNLEAGRAKPDSIGKPLPDFEVDVRGEELFVRGPGMLDAYLDPWRPQAEVLEDGWFRTGDLCRRDEDGCLYLVGRSHSVINVAGMKCFPEEVEAVLCEHPDIRAARVSGRPHPKAGAVPVAELVAMNPGQPPTLSSVVACCRAALARYKIPVEFRFVDAIPLTASGKIKRS